MITQEELIKKHYILQVKRIDPFSAKEPFYSYQGFGIECGKGWYDLLDELCTKIEKELDKEPELKKHFMVSQIKEKYGGLCFYIMSGTDRIYDFIHEAENKSQYICENCGKKGKTYEIKGWLITYCLDCAKTELDDWRNELMVSMAKSEQTINIFLAKKMKTGLTQEEMQEMNDAGEWLQRGNSFLEYIRDVSDGSLK